MHKAPRFTDETGQNVSNTIQKLRFFLTLSILDDLGLDLRVLRRRSRTTKCTLGNGIINHPNCCNLKMKNPSTGRRRHAGSRRLQLPMAHSRRDGPGLVKAARRRRAPAPPGLARLAHPQEPIPGRPGIGAARHTRSHWRCRLCKALNMPRSDRTPPARRVKRVHRRSPAKVAQAVADREFADFLLSSPMEPGDRSLRRHEPGRAHPLPGSGMRAQKTA